MRLGCFGMGTGVITSFMCYGANAEVLTFRCDAPSEMRIIYDGDASGTLTIKDASGEMSLPATKETRQGVGDDGAAMAATGIRAYGTVSAVMPDKAAIEACVREKLPADQLSDADIVFGTILSCGSSAPLGEKPVQIKANVEISVVEPPAAYVFITREFAEPSSLAGGEIELSSMPPPQCVLAE